MLAAAARTGNFGMRAWAGGSFLTLDEIDEDVGEDTATFEIHLHLYDDLAKNDDEVSFSGHAVWAKTQGQSNRRQFSIKATRHNARWVAEAEEGEEQINADPAKNPDSKVKIIGAIETLRGMVADVLNDDAGIEEEEED
jgi:hypothetical protein